MKLFKSKAFVGVICLVLAAAISFLLIPRFFAQQKATTFVPRATEEIEAGTVITEDMLSLSEIGSYGLPNEVLKEKESIIGMVATETIHDGEYFWKTALCSSDEYSVSIEKQAKGLESGYCLVTLKFPSASAGIAGILRAESRVDVYACTENRDDGSYVTEKVLDNMFVYDVLNSDFESLNKVDEAAENAIEGDNTNYNFEPTYVVIRCMDEQAAMLISLERAGALHLTLQRTEG